MAIVTLPTNPRFRNIAGQTFGRLNVLEYVGRYYGDTGKPLWRCVCSCGTVKIVSQGAMTHGKTQSCGCLHRERLLSAKTHGKSKRPEFRVWYGIIQRCTKSSNTAFKTYGARGISVCERWLKFENFLTDVGPRPSLLHSIDRFPNKAGNYEPGNVRWATRTEQSANRRNTINLEFRGRTQSMAAWAKEYGLRNATLYERIVTLGWSVERAITQPLRRTSPAYSRITSLASLLRR